MVIAVSTMAALSFLFASLLVLAHRKLHVDEDPRIDAAHQLLPHGLTNWLADETGNLIDENLFDVDFWAEHHLSLFADDVVRRVTRESGKIYYRTLLRYFAKHLERARRFSQSLSVPEYRLGVFGSDCFATPSKIRLISDGLTPTSRHADAVAPGDGTVTKASLLADQRVTHSLEPRRPRSFPLDHALPLCERHSTWPAMGE